MHLRAITDAASPAVTTDQRLPCLSLLVAGGLSLLPSAVFGAAAQLPSTTASIKIDGVLDEEAWRTATQIRIDTETNPAENVPARVETTAYLIEDGEKLYIAFDARAGSRGDARR